MTRWKVELHLPMLVVGAEDIQVKFGRHHKEAGPYLIIGRACGFAFDTAYATGPGHGLILWPPHALRHQLWYLRPTGTTGEASVISAANGLAIDATEETADPKPVMSEPTNSLRQRWRLADSPDGAGYLMQSVHNGLYLTVSEDAEPRWRPWFTPRHGDLSQQWIIALPHGPAPRK